MIKKRLSKLRALMAAKEMDAVLITLPANRRYLSGFSPDDTQIGESSGSLLIAQSAAVLLTDFRYRLSAQAQAPYFETVVYQHGLAHSLATLLADLRVKRLGFEADAMLVGHYGRLKDALPGVQWQPTSGLVSELRKYKDAAEIKATEASLALMESVLAQVMAGPLVGRSERDVALEIIRRIEDGGGEGPAFPPIVVSGPYSAEPHAEPGPRIITEGEPLLFDVGAKLNGYCSDISRTIIPGGLARADDTFRRVYQVTRQAQLATLEGILPGMLGHEADAIARDIIDHAGFRGKFGHALGHGVGLATHEAPSLSPHSEDMLEEGMIFTVEPGIYLAGWGGVRLEVMAVMDAEGCRLLGSLDDFYQP